MFFGLKQKLNALLNGGKKTILKIIFLFGMLFFLVAPSSNFSSTYANSNPSSEPGKSTEQIQREQLISWNNTLQVFSNLAYVILWPLVALAGLAMDNQLIYGSFMHLDTSLWNMWQIVRTFANYALGLIFLICILLYNLSPEKKIGIGSFMKGISNPMDLIKKTLIASILIQASWFILMAAVDISTVLTYSVGAIPTTLVATADQKFQDEKMLKMHTILNLSNEGLQKDATVDQAIVSYWEAENGTYIAPCATAVIGKETGGQRFIIGRAFDSLSGHNNLSLLMKPGYCSHMGALVSFADFASSLDEKLYPAELEAFKTMVKEGDPSVLQKLFNAGMIYPVSPGIITVPENFVPKGGTVEYKKKTYTSSGIPNGCDIFGVVPVKPKSTDNKKEYHCLYNKAELTISNIINKGKSMTGPFVSLYSNVFHFADIKGYDDLGNWQSFILSVINVGFGVLLVLPLLALVIVLFARIGVLWLAIATSPFIVLINVFDGVFGKDILPSWLTPKELIKLLIAPVLVSFAVSISLVFMTALKNTIRTDSSGDSQMVYSSDEAKKALEKMSGLTIEGDGDYSILGFVKIHFNQGLINLSWFLTMLFGVGITWFLLFWAIKQTKIGASVGGSLQKLGERTLSTMPLIPVGGKSVSFNAAKNFATSQTDKIFRAMEQDNLNHLEALFDKDKAKKLQEEQEALLKQKQEAEEKKKIEKAISDYSAPGQSYKTTFTPNFSTDANTTISTLDKVASHYYANPNSSLSADILKGKQAEISKEAKEGFDQMKALASTAGDPEQADSQAAKLKEDIENLLNIAQTHKFSWLNDLDEEISFGKKIYKIDKKTGKIGAKTSS